MEIIKTKKPKSKILPLIMIMSILINGGVLAYTVINGQLNIDVEEPFGIGVAVLGDGQPGVTCDDPATFYLPLPDAFDFDLDPMYPGDLIEGCVLIVNHAESDLPYEVLLETTCPDAIPEVTITGVVNGLNRTTEEVDIEVLLDAEPLVNCTATLYVNRG